MLSRPAHSAKHLMIPTQTSIVILRNLHNGHSRKYRHILDHATLFCALLLSIFLPQGLSDPVSQPMQSIFTSQQLKPSEVVSLINEGYHNSNETLSAAINRLVESYPQLVDSFTIGLSRNQVPLIGLKLAGYANKTTIKSKPGVALLGGIHGDHAVGHELVLYMAAFLLRAYKREENSRVKNLLDSTDVYLIPTLNPDGFRQANEGDCNSAKLSSGRFNANGADLDRDFKFHNYNDISSVLANNKLQPETKAFVDWIVTGGKSVKLFATLRTGYTGISYPYDATLDQRTEHTYGLGDDSAVHNPSPDRAFYEYLGHDVYYKYQDEPTDSICNPISSNVTVVNGAIIGPTYGTLSDFIYRFTNMFPLNVYLDCCKYPNRKQLESRWLQHANSMFALIESIKSGISGTVVDRANSKPINNARISIGSDGKNITTDFNGNYWRPLVPKRSYNLVVDADGYRNLVREKITGPESSISSSESLKMNFKLISLISSTKEVIVDTSETATVPHILKSDLLYRNISNQIDLLDFTTPTELNKHHNNSELEAMLKSLQQRFPKISRLYDIGTSVNGYKLWVLEISDHPGIHQLLKPEFRLIGNMHGNEVVGRELILNLAKLLLENYGSNPMVTSIINSTRIHLLPSMNPDGYEQSEEGDCESEVGRANARDYDLNRNFPDRFGTTNDNNITQPEVQAVIKWSQEYPFVLGANLHGGSLVANYPFDGNAKKKNGLYDPTPDDKLFIHLAKTYSRNHPVMYKGEHCYDICGNDRNNLLNERFKEGITNGAQWYVLYGGIQDWVYLNTNCLSITVELGCRKYPFAKDMPEYWLYNKKPLISFMLEVHKGIYGMITDQTGALISGATIHVKGIDHEVHSTVYGDYWRLLLPGEYLISVSKKGYRTAHRTITVGRYNSPAKRVDFSLSSGPKDLSIGDLGSVAIDSDTNLNDNVSSKNDSVGSPDVHLFEYKIKDTPQDDSIGRDNVTILMDVERSRLPDPQDSKYMLALCFIFVLPSIMLLVYLFGSTESKRYPNKLGFYRLATSAPDELDGEDDENEGTGFMRRSMKVDRGPADQASDSEDELYRVDDWSKN